MLRKSKGSPVKKAAVLKKKRHPLQKKRQRVPKKKGAYCKATKRNSSPLNFCCSLWCTYCYFQIAILLAGEFVFERGSFLYSQCIRFATELLSYFPQLTIRQCRVLVLSCVACSGKKCLIILLAFFLTLKYLRNFAFQK